MRQAAVLFGHLVVVWLLLSGHTEPFLLGFGLLSCIAVVLIVRHLGVLDPEALPVHLGIRPFLYIPWLLVEIVKSNIYVARVIVAPKLAIQPQVIRVPASQRSEVARVIFAHSITLTPGTISLDVDQDSVLVHALTDETAAGLLEGEMDRRVAALESDPPSMGSSAAGGEAR